MTAYACEPEVGSEPGVGWGWSNGLAQHVELTVVTRANNRKPIEDYYLAHPPAAGILKPNYLYYDPPAFALRLKRKGVLSHQVFFALWKLGAMWRFRGEMGKSDLLHHLTYSAIRLPSLYWFGSKPVVAGPVGGTSMVSPHYISLYGADARKELSRASMIRHWAWLPWIRLALGHAKRIVCANSEAEAMISKVYPEKTRRITEIGVAREEVTDGDLRVEPYEVLKLVWVGTMAPWKGWVIALRALAKAKEALRNSGGTRSLRLTMIGRGKEEAAAKALAASLGITGEVDFFSRIPLDELNERVVTAHAMVFSSIKDTSGTVVLEAMCKGKPVICLRHQGVGDITTPETAMRIEVGPLDQTVDGFAEAFVRLANDRDLLERLGRASRDRVLSDYIWERKSEKMVAIYREAVNE